MRTPLKKWIVWYLVAALFVIGITPRVYAGFAPSEGFALTSGERASNLDKVQKFLEMKMVRERLKDLGFTPEEIQGKLNDLNDQQLHQVAMKMDDLKVGGDSGLGIVIAILVIVILVIIIVQLSGHRIVVK
ncbi:MAG: PA2779 family protein [Deltaproteobacteria bacterium]|nr:PA2779 family protein [Deltaproteobacteria bacterium]